MFQISEFQLFSGSSPIRPNRSWRFNAEPNPWDALMAFDNNPVTSWKSWRSAMPGMYLAVRFSEVQQIDRVRLLTRTDCLPMPITLEGMDADGRWHALPVQSTSSEAARYRANLRAAAVRAMLDRGVRYLLVSQGALGANEFYENEAAWGIQRIGESGGTRLYALKDCRTDSPPPESVFPASEPVIGPGMYDDTDPRIALHAPWVRDTQFQETYRHTLTYTNIPDASIDLTFRGSSITYVYTRARNRGIAEIWIDDRLKDRLDLYASDTKWITRTTYGALGSGMHKARIRVTGEHSKQSSDCFVDLDAIIIE
jgi:hypothetical protein